MKTLRLPLAAAIFAAFMTGCASSGSAISEYANRNNSEARQIAMAGGISQVRDTVLGDQEYETAMSFGADVTANALLFNSSAGLGLNAGASLAAGLAQTMLSAPGNAERNSVFGWMPADQAKSRDEAQRKFLATYFQALINYLEDNGVAYEIGGTEVSYSRGLASWVWLDSPEQNCPRLESVGGDNGKVCSIVTIAFPPERSLREAPPFTAHAGEPSYAFLAGSAANYSRFRVIDSPDSDLNASAIFKGVSSSLPDWAFMYLAPKRNSHPAMVMAQGEPKLFITKQ